MSSKLSQFWQELKRLKVFKVIAMYATTAFTPPEGVRKTLQQAWELRAQYDRDHYLLLQEVDLAFALQRPQTL